jgi:hypothetical protein
MKTAKYRGNGYLLSYGSTYNIEDENSTHFKVRNTDGKLDWYSKKNFTQVTRSLSNSGISDSLVATIEKELKDTETRMAELQKKLKEAKNPPTKNLMLRSSQKRGSGWRDEVETALGNLVEAMMYGTDAFDRHGLVMELSSDGDGIELDRDYEWKLEQRGNKQVLVVLER